MGRVGLDCIGTEKNGDVSPRRLIHGDAWWSTLREDFWVKGSGFRGKLSRQGNKGKILKKRFGCAWGWGCADTDLSSLKSHW
ncbi:hypothetical protein SESBI_26991 [Sesbania bispinosa]|nr:hypothetical protein SESBI_26991 [Sesbania bispinosa]